MKNPVNFDSKQQRQAGMWRLVAVTAAIAFSASLSQMAWADGAGPRGKGGPGEHAGMEGHGPRGGGAHMGRMLDLVKATPEQRAQIKLITDAGRSEMQAQHEAGRALRQEQLTLFAQPNVDANAAEALRQRQSALHEQASKRRLQMQLDVSRVLTPEQRQMAAQKMQQRQQMRQRHQSERETLKK